MNTGQKVSILGHGGIILAVLLADFLASPRVDRTPPVTDVALVSAAEFAAMFGERPAPLPLPQPELERAPEPEPEPEPEPDTAAPITAPEPPQPPQDGTEDRPQAAVIGPQDSGPDTSLRPTQRPADRVAPEPVPTPEPEVEIGPADRPAVTPEAETAEPAPDAQAEEPATARAPAATETVTEATDLSDTAPPTRTATAPEVSLRPERRPARPAAPPPQAETPLETARPAPAEPAPEPTPEPTPEPERTPPPPPADAIADALAQALAGDGGPLAPESPGTGGATLSQADADGLRLRVEECWNVGALSTEAMNVVVSIYFEMTRDGRPVPGSIRLEDASGGGAAAQQRAFEAGRAAIIDCGTEGFGLPQDQYEAWREVVMTFNPARMSFR